MHTPVFTLYVSPDCKRRNLLIFLKYSLDHLEKRVPPEFRQEPLLNRERDAWIREMLESAVSSQCKERLVTSQAVLVQHRQTERVSHSSLALPLFLSLVETPAH